MYIRGYVSTPAPKVEAPHHVLLLSIFLLISYIRISRAAQPSPSDLSIPLLLHLFVVLNVLLLSLGIVVMLEVKTISRSETWNNFIYADIFAISTTITLALILHRFLQLGMVAISSLIAVFFSIAVVFDFFTHYLLIKPIAKENIKILKIKYVMNVLLLIGVSELLLNFYPDNVQVFKQIELIYIYAFITILLIIYVIYVAFRVSKAFLAKGYLYIPYFVASTGLISLVVHVILGIYFVKNLIFNHFYLIFFWLIAASFAVIYYGCFAINYPSIIERKWKILMPFDLPKVAAAITFLFLAIALFFTAKEQVNFALTQKVLPFFGLLLLPLSITVIFILTYLKQLSNFTKLIYWDCLKYGLFIHLTVTFYILSLLHLSWNVAPSDTKVLGILFGVVSFLFYLFFALDLHTILKEQKIEPVFDKIGIAHTIITLHSFLFIVLFAVSFLYKVDSYVVKDEILPNPVLLFFVAFFLIAFGTYLSITHKGFEEILGKNIWSELSYISAFLAFLLIYFMYSSIGAQISRFPYHNLAFIGYFVVLIIEIVSSITLAGKYQFVPKREDIVDLLNFHARAFLRTDYLEEYWRKTVSTYLDETERIKVSFDSARRAFDLTDLDEKTQRTVAVSMLLLMHKLGEGERVAIHRKSLDEAKGEILGILREKILQLPEELRTEFDEDVYYPLLLEKSINDLLTHLGTFVPMREHKAIFEGLRKRDEVFACINFETDEIHVLEGTRFGRDKFLELFKLYLEAVGDKFPFKRCLLRGLVKEEIRTDAHTPIATSEVFDIISTGVKELNLVMAGGLVKGSSTLLIAEETKAKQKMLNALITRNLSEGMSIVYATSKRPYQQIQGELFMECDSLDRVTMLDLYAPLYEEKGVSEPVEYDHRIIVPLSKILFQRSLVKVIKSQPRNQPRLVIIDVYDDFAKYYHPEELYELLQTQVEGLKRWDCTTILVLDPNSHLLKKLGVDEVKKNFENILVVTGVEKETVVQIEKLFHGTPGKREVQLEW